MGRSNRLGMAHSQFFASDRGDRGPPISDKRRTVNGILWVLRTGAPWRDMPERYGNWNSVFVRFTRWSKIGEWTRHSKPWRSWAARRQGACHQFHDRPSAPACSRRKRGNQIGKRSVARAAASRPKSTSARRPKATR